MPNWNEFEIKNFKGVAKSTSTPDISACEECTNLDPRHNLGTLRTRRGYELLYSAPTNARLTSVTYLNSENFYIPNIDGDESFGAEVTTYLNKGILNASGIASQNFNITDIQKANPCVITVENHNLSDSDLVYLSSILGMAELNGNYYYADVIDTDTIYICTDANDLAGSRIDSSGYSSYSAEGVLTKNPKPSNINALNVWIRPYFNGTAWVDSWQWLNELYLVKLYNTDTSNNYAKTLNMYDITLVNYFNGWCVYNITRSETAIIVKSYDAGTKIGIKLSDNSNRWTIGDDLLLMRHFLPYTEMVAMGTNVSGNDVVFHKILNEIRIAFGGKTNYHAIAVGFRKRFFRLKEFEFGDTDYVNTILNLNRVVVTPYNIIPYTPYQIGLAYSPVDPNVPNNGLKAGKYYFKLVALLDNINHFYVSKLEYELPVDAVIKTWAKMKLGSHSLRVTGFEIYFSTDDETYHLLKTIPLTDNTDLGNEDYIVNSSGYLSFGEAKELHSDNNAVVNSITDFNAKTGWTATNGAGYDAYHSFTVASSGSALGSYHFKMEHLNTSGLYNLDMHLQYVIASLEKNTRYNVKFRAKASSGNLMYAEVGGNTLKTFSPTTNWVEYDCSVVTNNIIAFGDDVLRIWQELVEPAHTFEIDAVSIKKAYSEYDYTLDTKPSEEMSERMGYTPTKDLAKSWDNALVTGGRVYAVNPLLDIRYENYIYSSLISGAGAFMWDVITADNYIQLENFDGNDISGMEILPNLDFLILRKNSTERRDSNTGVTREVLFGNGIIAKKSVVNFGDKIIWCGSDDVYLTNGSQVSVISDGTIRQQYRDIATKTSIRGIREDKESSYRFLTAQEEYVYTKSGWFNELRNNIPVNYLSSKDNEIIFASGGNIYKEDDGAADNGHRISFSWSSIPVDTNLIGGGATGNTMFYLRSFWINYVSTGDEKAANILVSIYLDNSSMPYAQLPFDLSRFANYQSKKIRVGASCRRFQIKITGSDYKGGLLEINSLGVMYKFITLGRHDGR